MRAPQTRPADEIIPVDSNVVYCNGGGGALGHPGVYLNLNNRLLSKLAAVSKMREASIAETQVYKEVHADSRSAATSEFASAVEFGEKSNSGEIICPYCSRHFILSGKFTQ